MRIGFFIAFILILSASSCQIPIYNYLDLERSSQMPEKINSERTAVVIHVPDKVDQFRKVGEWQKLAEKAHKAFVTMGIDAMLYLNHYDLVANQNSKIAYQQMFVNRRIYNLVFLTKTTNSYEIVIGQFGNTNAFLSSEKPVFYAQSNDLSQLLLSTGKEVRRLDNEIENFLIPESPNYSTGISIVEKTLLKNYPGILRRTKLVVERFAKLSLPESSNAAINQKIEAYNKEIDTRNELFAQLMEKYPYEYEFVDAMSDEDLLRRRHQFVLRSVAGQASTLRQTLDYEASGSQEKYVSTVPIMPDQTKMKSIPSNALVHKFYIRQNISKNIHVGEWDADETWHEALNNMIGNLIQEHQVDR